MRKLYSNLSYFLIILLVFGISIGYSAFSDRLLIEGAIAEVRIEKDIRITKIGIASSENKALSKYENFNTSNITSSVTLPNQDSTITYKIEITNLGNTEMAIKDIKGLPENLTYELLNYHLKDKICDNNKCSLGVKKELLLKIKYKEYNINQTNYSFNLDFDFKQIYKINYNIENIDNYPNEVLAQDTLTINFTDLVPNTLKIKMNNLYLEENKDYTFINNQLNIPNITGNLEISFYYKSYLKEIKRGEYFKEEMYFDKIKNIYFVDYIEEDNYVKSYDVSKEQNGNIKAWLVENNNNLDLYIGSPDIIKAPSLKGLFQDMSIEKADFSNLSTKETISFQDMFNNCHNLKSLDLSTFIIDEALTLEGMFANSNKLENINFSNMNLDHDINISNMFYNCSSLKDLKIGTFNTNITNYQNIFLNVNNNTIISLKNKEFKDWILNLSINDRPEVWSDANINLE